MKNILGLDLGTNSIGWALVDTDEKKIKGMGSRIIPMTQDVLDIFSGGKPLETQTSARTGYRGTRRIRERHLLRRERLHRVLNLLGFLPEHYAKMIDFNKHYGQFIAESEPKLPYNNRDFIFKKSFLEMLTDFRESQPQLFYTKPDGKETKVPYDWTIYYLRKKALKQRIEKEELAWIILNFNQKRGYYQLRGEEEEENQNKLIEFHSLKIMNVTADEKPNNKGEVWYSLLLENGWVYRRSSKTPLFDWNNKIRDFIVTTDINDDGSIKTDKDGYERRSFRVPNENDWTLVKKKTEHEIDKSKKTVGTYIYESLLQNPSQKIRGKLVRTIERKFYKKELIAILKKQVELQPELFTEDLYNDCVRELYRNNEDRQLALSKRDFVHLFVEDILFYQRPLRSQKSAIGTCLLEYREHKVYLLNEEGNRIKDENGRYIFKKDTDGKDVKEKKYLKVIPKSHPLYQEFRVWQWLSNLKIYRKEDDVDVTSEILKNTDDIVSLFDFLMTQKEVGHKDILKYLLASILKEKYPTAKTAAFNKELDKEIAKYRWNYVFDDSKEKEEEKSKKYPCNATGYEIRGRLKKVENVPTGFPNADAEHHLWHIIYSVNDKDMYKSALGKFARKHSLDEVSFVTNFEKFPPFQSEYGAYSEKAVKKFLPLMRMGKHWCPEAISTDTQNRIEKILTGEYDENIKSRVREKAINLTQINHFQGLPVWLASYLIYDQHSEASIAGKWNSVTELEEYLDDFKQHSLRNPIVEQIIMETLRVVRDIWKQYGNGMKNFFSEIHIELGREMKNTAEDRKYLSEQVNKNEATNFRIKALLSELKNDGSIDNVRPNSPTQQEILKIYEEYALQNEERYDETKKEFLASPISDDILRISKMSQPSKAELQRYKLWLEQRYRSPYTGNVIPLGRLFTDDYQIEHIIPKSRYLDDSFNNKVICESAVNQLKDKLLGFEFIKKYFGQEVELGFGKIARIFTENEYTEFIKAHYTKNKTKRQNLLLEDIPEKMIARQMNDTRYISKFISALLSNIVRAEKEDDGVNSKNLIPVTGKITTTLKKDWGMNNVWNELMLPRFERMNLLTQSENFTAKNQQGHTIPTLPPELSKGFQLKRIDHRHHAMDALIIACATRGHVQYLNNENAKSQKFHLQQALARKLRRFEEVDISIMKKNEFGFWTKSQEKVHKEVPKEFLLPWENFTGDAKTTLESIVVSFKQNLRVINKATNYYQKWIDANGVKEKKLVKQQGTNWAIRKSLHKETVSGEVDLCRIKVPKGKRLTATRKNVDTTFYLKDIESITDTGIQKILRNYLAYKDNNPELAFSPEGLEDMNANIEQYNDGKTHQPIQKVRIFELGSKFPLGQNGNKKDKFVEAAKGTNLYFAIYVSKEGKRNYETIPLNIIIEKLKQGLPPVEPKGGKDFFLTPNDLVYIPTPEERENPHNINPYLFDNQQRMNIYKVVSFTGNQIFFVKHDVATSIINKAEFSTLNKMERAIDGTMIKECCIKLKIDRLGNLSL